MKAVVPGVGYLPEFLAREAPEAPQNIKAIAAVVDCMSNVDVRPFG